MNEPVQPQPDACNSFEHLGHDGDRREFVRLALGLGACVVGSGHALGQSLLLRCVAAGPSSLDGGNPTTLTASQSNSYVVTGTVPGTITFSGVETPPQKPGTFTRSSPPDTSNTFSQTQAWPAPNGKTQPVTIAGTIKLSFTPPATNIQTGSWKGNSWTTTVSRSPTFWTASITEIRTMSYTSTTPSDGGEVEEAPAPDSIEVARNGGDELKVESIDSLDLDLFDSHSRSPQAQFLRLACGVGR